MFWTMFMREFRLTCVLVCVHQIWLTADLRAACWRATSVHVCAVIDAVRCFLRRLWRVWSWGSSSSMCCTHAGLCSGSFTPNPARSPRVTAVSLLTWPGNLDCRWDCCHMWTCTTYSHSACKPGLCGSLYSHVRWGLLMNKYHYILLDATDPQIWSSLRRFLQFERHLCSLFCKDTILTVKMFSFKVIIFFLTHSTGLYIYFLNFLFIIHNCIDHLFILIKLILFYILIYLHLNTF